MADTFDGNSIIIGSTCDSGRVAVYSTKDVFFKNKFFFKKN